MSKKVALKAPVWECRKKFSSARIAAREPAKMATRLPLSPVSGRPGTRLARYAHSFLKTAFLKFPREVQITTHFDSRVAFTDLLF